MLTAGKVDLSNYFDNNGVANDETAQFLATTLVNSSAIEFPDNGPGMRLTFNLSDNVAFSLGSMEGDADFEDVFDDLFVMGELDISADFLSAAGGNYRFFAWLNATDHVSLKNPALMREKGYGYGISFDQGVTDDFTLFARAGWQTDEVYPLEVVWSAGFELKTGFLGRENDAFGVAYAHGIANSAVVGLEDEGRLELYYSVFINERISLTPDVQVVFNPTGSKALDDVVVLGLRVQVVF